jgi:hypothetical protein
MVKPVYELYKPLRNSVRGLCLEDALEVLWHYSQHYATGRPIGPGIGMPRAFTEGDVAAKMRLIAEWDIEFLVKEVILHARQPAGSPKAKSLRDLGNLSRCANKLKTLSDELSDVARDEETMLQHFHRMAHQQFRWQARHPDQTMLVRYYKLYKHEPLRRLFESVIGLSLVDYFMVSLAFYGYYQDRVFLEYPPRIENLPELTQEKLERFVARFALPLKDWVAEQDAIQVYDNRFIFAHNTLRLRPLVGVHSRGSYRLACPMTKPLAWRMTSGIYYDFAMKVGGFGSAFGDAFQEYVGNVLTATCEGLDRHVLREQTFKGPLGQQRTVDWIVVEAGLAVFMECKTKRLSQAAKEEIGSTEALHRDLDELSKAIVQTYKGIQDHEQGRYPQLAYKSDRRICPIVVTLEDWFFMGTLQGYVRAEVARRLQAAGLEEACLVERPYIVCSVTELEILMLCARTEPLDSILDGYTNSPQYAGWSLDAYLADAFGHLDIDGALLSAEFNELLPERLRD